VRRHKIKNISEQAFVFFLEKLFVFKLDDTYDDANGILITMFDLSSLIHNSRGALLQMAFFI